MTPYNASWQHATVRVQSDNAAMWPSDFKKHGRNAARQILDPAVRVCGAPM